ncbi:hypothetical protein Vretifemale_11128 [Volvox reticuliferus]|uniref:Cullin family profile domain-containing protein n=1 Tax=Volvox reticuliferus TaxID=1737510 RepID=A0A8J4CI42_9CHLO|nr:hypothetical protein Vretifemale_11128 [Volvox reticuliferus]
MLKAEECLRLEEERVENYLHVSTKPKLLKEVEAELLSNYETRLLTKEHSGCAALLKDDKTDDLARMYRLFQRIPKGLDPVAEIFKEHVDSEGMKLVKEVTEAVELAKEKQGRTGPSRDTGSSHEQQYVRAVIDLHDKYLQYVSTCFCNSSLFHKSLKEAFENFVNKSVAGSTSAELMASFCDNLLKKGGSEKLSDEAIEETLEKVVKLLAYVSDKDMFAEFYRKKLSRRLLQDKSASDDHERSLLSRLKQQCGAQFTSKMEGMVTDLQLAKEKQQHFDDWLKEKGKKLGIELSVTVLTTGFWPTYKSIEVALPREMVEGVEVYRQYYDSDSKHRKLTWIYTLGTAVVRGNFQSRAIEMQMNTLQAALCMLLNDMDELMYAEVMQSCSALCYLRLRRVAFASCVLVLPGHLFFWGVAFLCSVWSWVRLGP